ncbi:MAG TPA: nuclear transport factor 2 family protein [Acidimicrobiales bacterium]|nr:nuclear transport factor 2 family protein [Acidimicrobiales bacterium]
MSLKDDMIAFIKTIESGDTDVVLRTCHPDLKWISPFGANEGNEGQRQWSAAWYEACPDTVHNCFNWFEDEGRLVYQMDVVGTFTGPMVTPTGTLLPTGVSFISRGCSFVHWRDGKITEWRTYFDPDILFDMGMLPRPDGA